MAEERLKRIDEQLTCSVCLELFEEPKLLECLHVYCQRCLERFIKTKQKQRLDTSVLNCPSCRKPTPVPEGGVGALKPAFHLKSLFEIRATFVSKDSSEDSEESPPSPTSLPDPKKPSLDFCEVHEDSKINLYCETCQEVICIKCTFGEHNGHTYGLVGDVANKCKGELSSVLAPIEAEINNANRGLGSIDARYKEAVDIRDSVEGEIDEYFKEAHQILSERRLALIGKLQDLSQMTLKSLAAERNAKEARHSQLSGTTELVRTSLVKSDIEMLRSKKSVMGIAEATLNAIKKYPNLRNVDTDIEVKWKSPSKDIFRDLKSMGDICGPDLPDPKECTASGISKSAEVGRSSMLYLNVNTEEGYPYERPVKSLEGELVCRESDVTLKCDLKKIEANRYEIRYTPTQRGKHRLNITIKDTHIRGSPFKIIARIPIEHIEKPSLVIDKLLHPWGVTTTPSGDIIVTEYMTNAVLIFNSRGERKHTFGGYGSNLGLFKGPSGVAVDSEGQIYVVDAGNYRIQKFTAEGHYLDCVGQRGKGVQQFVEPKDAAFNTVDKRLYIADAWRIQVLNSDLIFCPMIGYGKLKNAFGIACDSAGIIYVSDIKNKNIQKFSVDGQCLQVITPNPAGWLDGIKGGKAPFLALTVPVTIAVDSNNYMYVSDEVTHKISVLSPEGAILVSFGSEGADKGQFQRPHAIAVDECGLVYVCDRENNRLQVF